MRRLLFFTIGFAAGCAMGVWLLPGSWMFIAAMLCAVAFAVLWYVHPNQSRKIGAVILLGATISLCWTFTYDLFYVDTARKHDGESKTVTIELTDYSEWSGSSTSGTGRLKLDGKSYKVQFYLNEGLELYPGETVSGTFSFRFTGYGGEDSPTYHQGKGIFLIAYADGPVEYTVSDHIPAKHFAAVVRKRIIEKINEIFPEDQLGFARALLLGDTSDLSYEDDSALKISGIRHVVAVSGLHVSILISFAYVFSGRNRYVLAGIGFPLLFLFTAVAGFTPSIVRASVMQGLIILGVLFDNEYDPPTALASAVLLLIAVNPLVITSVSFQLSVGCVVGIMLFSKKIHDVLLRTKLGPAKGKGLKPKLIRGFVQSVSVTLSTMAVTVPLCAYYFGSVSLVSIFTNMLTLWIVSICFYGVVISCIIGFISSALGAVIAGVISWPMRLVLIIAKLLSKVPFAAVSVYNIYFLAWIIICYVLFALFLISKKRKALLFAGLSIFCLCLSGILAYVEPRMEQYRMTVLDVGQGQSILLQSKDGCFVVDCGGDTGMGSADLAAQALRSCGVQRIDGLILTHLDSDHSGGMEYFLSQISADRIYLPAIYQHDEIGDDFDNRFECSIEWVSNKTVLDCGLGEITIFPGEDGKTGNEGSLCILFQAAECDILITGDRNNAGERYLLDNYDIPQLDILVAGHHGADSSTSLYLLQNTQPSAVVISVGEDNRYGHPDSVVLQRLERFDCTIWRTDLDGTIIFRG